MALTQNVEIEAQIEGQHYTRFRLDVLYKGAYRQQGKLLLQLTQLPICLTDM